MQSSWFRCGTAPWPTSLAIMSRLEGQVCRQAQRAQSLAPDTNPGQPGLYFWEQKWRTHKSAAIVVSRRKKFVKGAIGYPVVLIIFMDSLSEGVQKIQVNTDIYLSVEHSVKGSHYSMPQWKGDSGPEIPDPPVVAIRTVHARQMAQNLMS